jgi:hypothetical protein
VNRKKFLQTIAILPLAGATMKLNELNKMTEPFSNTEQMPVLFLGHGSPMNAIHENERDHIVATLKKCDGRIWGIGGAAEVLNIPPTTLKF